MSSSRRCHGLPWAISGHESCGFSLCSRLCPPEVRISELEASLGSHTCMFAVWDAIRTRFQIDIISSPGTLALRKPSLASQLASPDVRDSCTSVRLDSKPRISLWMMIKPTQKAWVLRGFIGNLTGCHIRHSNEAAQLHSSGAFDDRSFKRVAKQRNPNSSPKAHKYQSN